MANRIILRRDTAVNWTIADPILANGEIGLETDTERFKIGNGISPWSERSYYANADFITAEVQDIINGLLAEAESTQVAIASALEEVNDAVVVAQDAASDAADAVALAGTTTDGLVATAVGNASSSTRTQLNALYGISVAQTLTNKTISMANNTITGTTAQFNAAMTDGDFITASSTTTLTNKTLTSPTINSPTVSTPTVTGGSYSGGTFNNPTITGAGVTLTGATLLGGTFSSPGIENPTIEGASIGTSTLSSPTITGVGQHGFIRKTSNQSFSDNSTWVNDTQLLFTATAGGVYIFSFAWGINAGTGSGLEASVTHGGVGTFTHNGISPLDVGHTNGGTGRLDWGDSGSGLAHGRGVHGLFYHNTTGSNVTVNVRFRTIDVGTSVVSHGWLKYERVA